MGKRKVRSSKDTAEDTGEGDPLAKCEKRASQERGMLLAGLKTGHYCSLEHKTSASRWRWLGRSRKRVSSRKKPPNCWW